MERTTTPQAAAAAAAAPEPGSPKASGNKLRRKAVLPLGDVTNLLPSTPRNPSTRRPLPLPSDTSASTTRSSASASASATPVSKGSFAAVVEEQHSLIKSTISTVYTRRKTTERRSNPTTNNKAPFPAGTTSCPPLGKATRTNSHLTRKASVAQDTRPISSSVPCHEAKKKRRTKMENLPSGQPKLLEDFVKKQIAYFEEVDAFELPEEETSETDLE